MQTWDKELFKKSSIIKWPINYNNQESKGEDKGKKCKAVNIRDGVDSEVLKKIRDSRNDDCQKQ